jgi:hypothetical protein
MRDRQGAREVGEEDGTRLERRDQQWLASCVRRGKLGAELGDAPTDLGARQVDIPDGMSVRRERGSQERAFLSYDASFSRSRWARRSMSRR